MQEIKEKVVISEHRQRCLVNDRNVSQFKMRLQSLVRQHGGLNDRRKSHSGVNAAGFRSIPRPPGLRIVAGMEEVCTITLLAQHEAAHSLVGARAGAMQLY